MDREVEAVFAADTELLEYVCNENQTFHEHWVGTRLDAQRSEIACPGRRAREVRGNLHGAAAVLARRGGRAVFEITLMDGTLFLGPTRLSAQSDTVFVNSGLAIEFVRDRNGAPTHLFDKHVSGDYRFDRRK